ncbi:MAG: primosomal protein N' [Clostridiaceae bacterium]|nr:primosomal protein N' [Clostridiaceae bacterium]
MYVGIVVNNEATQVDKIFTYEIPKLLEEKIQIGCRVKVPFGFGNKYLDGFVLELYDIRPNMTNIKEIVRICDSTPILRVEDILLIKKMKEKYLCTYLDCIKTIIPTGLLDGLTNKTVHKVSVIKKPEGRYDKPIYNSIYDIIVDNNGIYTSSELNSKFCISISSLGTLIKNGFLSKEKVIINRYNEKTYDNYEEKKLNSEQASALDTILNSSVKKFMIHGITGSGKTEIYLHLVSEMLRLEKGSIVLVPEISLTPQMVERFKGRFGNDIAVFHSKLSEGERHDEWFRVKTGKVKVAVGARSAIFLPMKNLGLIIIDEEHEGSYKSENSPKYNAREIADFKQFIEGAIVVLGSATPSIETYFNTIRGKYNLISLKNRADGAFLPEVEIIDMREELAEGNKSMFSRELYKELVECLDRKEQAILFLNRRGFSSFVSCRKCGYVFKCSDCDISLTYHSFDETLVCHYCGKKEKVSNICPKCKSKYVKFFGIGTEKIEQEVKRIFKDARVLRMDFDTTRKKNSYEEIYNIFKENRADILIGTQMIAKGLDFKNVTLVGVVAADISLNIPDFRAGERTFQLLTQVSGRAGRGKKPGKVIIQTYNPEHYSLRYAAQNNYMGFYEEDITIRKNLNYPPYSNILALNFSSKNEVLLIKTIQSIGVELKSKLKDSNINILGPCPSGISKIKEQFRWQIVLKGEINIDFASEIKIFISNLIKSVYNEIRVSLDINPNSLL